MPGFATPPTVVPIEDRVGEWRKRCGDAVTPAGFGIWWITRTSGGAARTLVAVDRDWLVVEQTLPDYRLARIDDVQRWGPRLLDAALGTNIETGVTGE